MPMHRTIAIGQSVELIDGPYKLVALQGTLFKLRSELTDETLLLHHVELFRLLPPGTTLETTEMPVVVEPLAEALDNLDSDTRALTRGCGNC